MLEPFSIVRKYYTFPSILNWMMRSSRILGMKPNFPNNKFSQEKERETTWEFYWRIQCMIKERKNKICTLKARYWSDLLTRWIEHELCFFNSTGKRRYVRFSSFTRIRFQLVLRKIRREREGKFLHVNLSSRGWISKTSIAIYLRRKTKSNTADSNR